MNTPHKKKKESELLREENEKHDARALRRRKAAAEAKKHGPTDEIELETPEELAADGDFVAGDGVYLSAMKGITIKYNRWTAARSKITKEKLRQGSGGRKALKDRQFAKRRNNVEWRKQEQHKHELASHLSPLVHGEYRGFKRSFPEELKLIPKLRVTSCQKYETQVASKIEQILRDVDASLLNSICDYVTRSTDVLPSVSARLKKDLPMRSLDASDLGLGDDTLDRILSEFTKPAYYEIPTALLFVGVNVTDHHRLFGQLKSNLQSSPLAHRVALLVSSDCPTLPKALKRIATELMGEYTSAMGDSPMAALQKWYAEEGWWTSKPAVVKVPTEVYESSLPMDDMGSMGDSEVDVAQWGGPSEGDVFNEDAQDGENSGISHWRRSSMGAPVQREHPALVIMLEDFESFNDGLLRSLVSVISHHQSSLPFVFVFGLATSANALHKALSRVLSVRLSTEKFNFHAATHSLDVIVNQIIIKSETGVCLGKRAFELMMDNFYNWNLSIQTFGRALKFVIGEHFWGNPLSFLCSLEAAGSDNTITPEQLEGLVCDVHCDVIRKLPSIQSYLQTASKEASKSLEDNSGLRQRVAQWINDIKRYHKNLSTLFECCFDLLCRFKTSKENPSLQTAYKLVITARPKLPKHQDGLTFPASSGLLVSELFINAICRLREVPLHEVVEMCESWVGILQSAPTLQPIQLSTTSPTTEMGDEPKGKELQGYLHPLTRAFVETLEGFISRLKSAESASTSVPASGESATRPTNMMTGSPLRKSSNSIPLPAVPKPLASAPVESSSMPPPGNLSPRSIVPGSPSSGRWTGPVPLVRGSSFDRLQMLNGLVDSFSDSIVKQLIGEIQQWIIDLFSTQLPSYETFPLNEAFYYNEAQPLRRVLNADMLTNVKKALSKPGLFLSWDGEEIPLAAQPDVCIVYNLWDESGHTINLRDMFDSFCSILENNKENSSQGSQSAELLARFYDAVGELQLMGFISQPKSRKNKDLVTKLTVGGRL